MKVTQNEWRPEINNVKHREECCLSNLATQSWNSAIRLSEWRPVRDVWTIVHFICVLGSVAAQRRWVSCKMSARYT